MIQKKMRKCLVTSLAILVLFFLLTTVYPVRWAAPPVTTVPTAHRTSERQTLSPNTATPALCARTATEPGG